MINEKNFGEVLDEYVVKKYGRRLQKIHDSLYDEYPYKSRNLPDELYLKNFMDWIVFEKELPETGKTVLDEFLDENPDIDEKLRQKLLQMKNVIRSSFVVIAKKGLNLKLKDMKSKIAYNIILSRDIPQIEVNDLIIGRICEFGESYKLIGAISVEKRPYLWNTDVMMEQYSQMNINEAEEMVLHPKSKLTAILNKYPANWVDGICVQYSINTKGKKNIKVKEIATEMEVQLLSILESLPEKSKEALKIVLDEGGFVKYNRLKDYSDAVTYWWKDDPPISTIGLLRLNGLLAVGKMPMSGRMYKVAFIPFDIREMIEELL